MKYSLLRSRYWNSDQKSIQWNHFWKLDVNGRSEAVPGQLVPIPGSVLNLPGRQSSAKFEFIFLAADLPALGSRSYYVTLDANQSFELDQTNTFAIPAAQDVVVSTKDWKLRWDVSAFLWHNYCTFFFLFFSCFFFHVFFHVFFSCFFFMFFFMFFFSCF